MALLTRNQNNFSMAIIPASMIVGTIASPSLSWSEERNAVQTYEAVARLHFESRPSSQIDSDQSEDYEFTAIPLIQSRVVKVKFRHTGQLPPMSLHDEVLEDE